MTRPIMANNSQNEIPLYHNYHTAIRTMSARRERVTEHPLQSRGNSPLQETLVVPKQIVTTSKGASPPSRGEVESTSTHSSLTTTVNTASLIQSAARSVLDSVYTPTSTNVSDDEDEGENDQERKRQQRHMAIPTLESLQKESLPAMPDEQDRKRFVVSRILSFNLHFRKYIFEVPKLT